LRLSRNPNAVRSRTNVVYGTALTAGGRDPTSNRFATHTASRAAAHAPSAITPQFQMSLLNRFAQKAFRMGTTAVRA